MFVSNSISWSNVGLNPSEFIILIKFKEIILVAFSYFKIELSIFHIRLLVISFRITSSLLLSCLSIQWFFWGILLLFLVDCGCNPKCKKQSISHISLISKNTWNKLFFSKLIKICKLNERLGFEPWVQITCTMDKQAAIVIHLAHFSKS